MKKLYNIFTLVVVTLLFASCNSNQDEVPNYAQTPAQDAVGVYEGTWQAISSFTGDTTYQTGRIEITTINDSTAYVCTVTIINDGDASQEIASWKKTSTANVAHGGTSGDILINNDGSNGIGSPFTSRIYGDGSVKFSCAISSKMIVYIDGTKYKKNVIVAYSFDGTKKQ